MARSRDVPPDDMPTQPIDAADPSVREPTRRRAYDEEVYEEPPEEPPPWWRRSLWIWLLVLLLLVVGGILLLWFLQNDDDGGNRAVVPAVVGMTEADAVREITDAGLEPVANPGESNRPEGEVFAQAPGGGSQLEEGEPVVISISTGPPTTTTVTTTTTETVTPPPPPPAPVTVPDVVGQNHADAAAALEGNGLVVDGYPVPSAEPAGIVVSQRPAAGTEVREGDTVRLNVSIGEGPRDETEVPDLTGLDATEARQRARIEGFTTRTILREAPSDEEVGEVLTQSPAAGTTAPILTQITLYVGR